MRRKEDRDSERELDFARAFPLMGADTAEATRMDGGEDQSIAGGRPPNYFSG